MRKDQRGQSMVETALLLPVFLLILLGIIDFGRLIYSYAHLQMAAQETVRLGGLGHSDQEISDFAHKYINFSDKTMLTLEISPKDTIRHSGDYVTVKLHYPFRFLTPMISKLFPSTFTIDTDSTIRVE